MTRHGIAAATGAVPLRATAVVHPDESMESKNVRRRTLTSPRTASGLQGKHGSYPIAHTAELAERRTKFSEHRVADRVRVVVLRIADRTSSRISRRARHDRPL